LEKSSRSVKGSLRRLRALDLTRSTSDPLFLVWWPVGLLCPLASDRPRFSAPTVLQHRPGTSTAGTWSDRSAPPLDRLLGSVHTTRTRPCSNQFHPPTGAGSFGGRATSYAQDARFAPQSLALAGSQAPPSLRPRGCPGSRRGSSGHPLGRSGAAPSDWGQTPRHLMTTSIKRSR
jgi:hypothetical protein